MSDKTNSDNDGQSPDDMKLLREMYGRALKRRITMLGAHTDAVCTVHDENDCADYLDMLMTEQEAAAFEQHFPDCPACLMTLLNIIIADETASRDSRLSRLSQRRSLTRVLERVSELRQGSEPLLLAASPERKVFENCASGIGVNPQSGRGDILDCVAHVFEEDRRGGSLHVIGSQVEEREIDGKRIKGTPPLVMVEEVLSVLFKNQPFFLSNRCADRHITIQVYQQQEGYLSEGLSLSLAAAAAVYCALTGRKLPGNVVFSGNLEITGRLKKIGHFMLKAQVAREQGKTVMILPKENEQDLDHLPASVKETMMFLFFETLEEVLRYFDRIALPEAEQKRPAVVYRPAGADSHVTGVDINTVYIGARQFMTVHGNDLQKDMRITAPNVRFQLRKAAADRLIYRVFTDKAAQESREHCSILNRGEEVFSFDLDLVHSRYLDRVFRLDRYPVAASVTLGLYLVLLVSGVLFSLRDFLLALSFKTSLPSHFHEMVQAGTLIIIAADLVLAFARKRGRGFIKSALFYSMFFMIVSLLLFSTAPFFDDRVAVYNKAGYYIKNPLLSGLFSDVPNIPVREFKKSVQQRDPRAAYDAARRVLDTRDFITDVYIPLSGLMEREHYRDRQAAFMITRRFLASVGRLGHDVTLKRKIHRGLQAAAWIAESYGDDELLKEIEKKQNP